MPAGRRYLSWCVKQDKGIRLIYLLIVYGAITVRGRMELGSRVGQMS